MNFTLHWLRRDLRRHAPALALWMLLVALFTWARIWLRTHPQLFIGDRDLWLSVPAAGLGFAEVCLLLRVLLDDPARGPHAFWKTRPPSGGAVCAAKMIVLALAALVIPFSAEAVFLSVVGPSAGTPERISFYLLPPVLALMAGAVTTAWKGTLLWLPVVAGVLVAGIAVLLWLTFSERGGALADHRLIAVAVLLVASAGAVLLYRRRTAGGVALTAAIIAPAIGGFGIARTGWPRDPRLHTPPPGIDNSSIQITWLQPPQVSRNSYGDREWGLVLPLRVNGLKAGTYADPILRDLSLEGNDISLRRVGYSRGNPNVLFSVPLSEDEAKALSGKSWNATGTLLLRISDRTHHSLPLEGAHTVDADDCRWIITPAVKSAERRVRHHSGNPDGRFWCEYEFMNLAPLTHLDDGLVERETVFLRRSAGSVSQRLENFHLGKWFNLWEGIGRGGISTGFGTAQEARELYDPANWKDWTLDFDTLTLAGTLEVPFTLHWPAMTLMAPAPSQTASSFPGQH